MRLAYIITTLFYLLTVNSHRGNSQNIQIDSIPHSARLLSEYIQYSSVTGFERQAGLFFANVCREKGLIVKVLTDKEDSFNFAASLYPLELMKPNIIFLNHIDVVPAYNEVDFTFPPFSGEIHDGMVWGRGAIDNKGMAVMQLIAIEHFVRDSFVGELPFNVTLLCVSGEETGGHNGAMIVAENFLELLNPVVVYGEGGMGAPGLLVNHPNKEVFTISVAFKRSLWLKLTLNMNTSAHGSVPPNQYAVQEKVRAMYRVVRWNRRVIFSPTTRVMFRELGKLEGGSRGLVLRNLGMFRPLAVRAMRREEIVYSLITNTVTITGIHTPPGPPNQIPQEITVVLDCRLLPEVKTEDFIREVDKVLGNSDVKIEILNESKYAKPTRIDDYYYHLKNAIIDVFPKAGVMPILTPASNDNNYFRAHGIPVYGLLPVYIDLKFLETIHNVDERIPIDALEKGVEIYKRLIYQIQESIDEY
jgi:acetylornithine deacetylase/succinyl-diaminopimelate desuccinylase-like protein